MIWRLVLCFVLLTSGSEAASRSKKKERRRKAKPPAVQVVLPPNFLVRYTSSNSQLLFYLESLSDASFGVVTKESDKNISFFHLKDMDENLIATGKSEKSGKEEVLEIYDSNLMPIGCIHRETFTFVPTQYKLFDGNQNLVSISDMNWLRTRFTLVDPEGGYTEYMTAYRPYFHLAGDYWYFHFKGAETIDSRLLVMVGVLESDIGIRENQFYP